MGIKQKLFGMWLKKRLVWIVLVVAALVVVYFVALR